MQEHLTDEQVLKLVSFGVSKIDRINDVLLEADDLRALKDEQLTIAVICYAASLAKLTKLNLIGLLQLVTNTYQNVDISKKDKVEKES